MTWDDLFTGQIVAFYNESHENSTNNDDAQTVSVFKTICLCFKHDLNVYWKEFPMTLLA